MTAPGHRTYAEFGGVLVVSYLAVPALRGSVWLYAAVGTSATVAIMAGVARNRPSARLPWFLIAGAQVTTVVGDVLTFHFGGAFPSAADAFYLLSYPLMAAGLVLLVRHRTPGRDLASLLDAAIITVGLGVLVWVFLIAPHGHDQGMGLVEKSISVAYPLMDLLLVGVVVRLAVDRGSHPPAFSLLMASFLFLLAADIAYGVVELAGSYGDSTYLDPGWLLSYLLCGMAALHPSMGVLSRRTEEPRPVVGTGRLAVLGGALLLAPAVLAVRQVQAEHAFPVVVVASGALSLLVLARMTGLVRDLGAAVVGYQRAERSKEDFVSNVSHELRTPLTSIIGSIEILSDGDLGPLNEAQQCLVDVVERNSERLLRLIEELLTLSKISAASLTRGGAAADLTRMVEAAAAAIAPTLARRTLTMHVEISAGLGSMVLDARQIERVLLNLLSNAVKFTPDGGTIELRAERTGGEAVFTVADTGIGIPAAEQAFVFDRFFRSTTATSLAIQGTGLGLSIVRAIVEAHGGTVTLRSSPEEGTTVTVALPVTDGHHPSPKPTVAALVPAPDPSKAATVSVS